MSWCGCLTEAYGLTFIHKMWRPTLQQGASDVCQKKYLRNKSCNYPHLIQVLHLISDNTSSNMTEICSPPTSFM